MFDFEMIIDDDSRVAVFSAGEVDYFIQFVSDGSTRSKSISFDLARYI